MTPEDLAAAFGAAAAQELVDALGRIRHCLDQLTEEQVWWHPDRSRNAIGNLILHLAGNVRQWIAYGVGGAADVRDRPAEFAERRPVPRAELLATLEAAVADARKALAAVTASQLLETRRIQGFDVTGMAAIFGSVAHFRGHTQEIIHLTRAQLGDAYRFAWVPATPEQGAPP
jgi:hypothetical protein